MQLCGFELRGAAYDHVLESICDRSPESESGFGQLVDLFVISCSCDEETMKIQPNFVKVPIEAGGFCFGAVELPNKTERSIEDWGILDVRFIIPDQ